MHPLESMAESDLVSLVRVGGRLLGSRRLLGQGYRSNRLRAGSGSEFLDHREYIDGDDIRRIDWRTSARSRLPQIRRYCDEAAADWFVVLDNSASMAVAGSGKWALALQCAAAACYLLLHLGNRVSLLIFSDRLQRVVPPGWGYAHGALVFRTLRNLVPARSGGGSRLRSCAERITPLNPVFVISDFLTADGMKRDLDLLAGRGDRVHALQILSPGDFALPNRPQVRVRDPESGQAIDAGLDADGRDRLRRAQAEFRAELADHCRRKRIGFSRHGDDEHWKSVLVDHLRGGGKSP